MGNFIATLDMLSEDEKKTLDAIINGFAKKIAEGVNLSEKDAKASVVSMLDKGLIKIAVDDDGNFSLLPTTKAGKAMLKGLLS